MSSTFSFVPKGIFRDCTLLFTRVEKIKANSKWSIFWVLARLLEYWVCVLYTVCYK